VQKHNQHAKSWTRRSCLRHIHDCASMPSALSWQKLRVVLAGWKAVGSSTTASNQDHAQLTRGSGTSLLKARAHILSGLLAGFRMYRCSRFRRRFATVPIDDPCRCYYDAKRTSRIHDHAGESLYNTEYVLVKQQQHNNTATIRPRSPEQVGVR
jgi:hypothetical protein